MRAAFLERRYEPGESSVAVAERVLGARERQRHRLAPSGWRTNGEVPGPALRKRMPLPEGSDLLDVAVARGRLSARGVDKVLRLAWTVADLEGVARPTREHLHTALAMRRGENRTETA